LEFGIWNLELFTVPSLTISAKAQRMHIGIFREEMVSVAIDHRIRNAKIVFKLILKRFSNQGDPLFEK
jgi:hypothetical protein